MSCDFIYREDAVTKAAVGVLGDLADTLGSNAAPLFQNSSFYKKFLQECQTSQDQQLKETADWALAIINHVLSK